MRMMTRNRCLQIVNYVGEFGEDWLHVTEIFCNAGKVNSSIVHT